MILNKARIPGTLYLIQRLVLCPRNHLLETTIDGYLNAKTEHVPAKKIHSAVVRILTGSEQNEIIRTKLLNIYKTFSGYIHANYSHIMQIYGGTNLNFNLPGVPSIQQREMHMQLVEQAYLSVLYSIGFAAHKFGLTDIYREVSSNIWALLRHKSIEGLLNLLFFN